MTRIKIEGQAVLCGLSEMSLDIKSLRMLLVILIQMVRLLIQGLQALNQMFQILNPVFASSSQCGKGGAFQNIGCEMKIAD